MPTISKTRTNTWKVRIRIKGHRPLTRTFPTRKSAVQWGAVTEGRIRSGERIREPHIFRALIDHYQQNVAPKYRDQKARCSQLEWWAEALHSSTYLENIEPHQIAQAKARIAETRSPSTVNHYLSTLSHAFQTAKDLCWTDHNPTAQIKKVPEPQGRTRFLSRPEIRQLLQATSASPDHQIHFIVQLALLTGMRQGEIMSITLETIHHDPPSAYLPTTKNGQPRTVPLTPAAYKAALALEPHQRFPRRAWDRVVEAAQLLDFRFHDLRHTAASYLAMGGASTMEVATILGHKTLGMTYRYSHFSEGHSRELLTALAEGIEI